ncbi:MAG: ABC transporter ATP-binding protein/permease [Oscillospiraceae bacterium]|nr:ABC transporter ATP-binding protein/permease [Oscillospiraceae bacterium]
MLSLSQIVKDYKLGGETVHALQGVSLSFRKSEFVAILGQSGCGKTTLLNIIGGLDRYTSGDLTINGRSTKDFSDGDWDAYRNRSIGFVFQSYQLISHQTVLKNVELALTLSGVGKAERRQRAVAALEQVGLGDQLRKKPAQMSGGQMQRVAIARALVNDPDIVLADEPTGALDTETSIQIMEILKEISRTRLVIMVTHNPDLADTYATRTVRLLDGVVTGDSDPYDAGGEDDNPYVLPERKKRRKTAMSFFTALDLSRSNLLTKKGRTLLTAFAGSIGIIGIALILSLSNGIQNYIDRVQEDALSTYPLTITSETMDMSAMVSTMAQRHSGETQHELDAVYSSTVMSDFVDGMLNTTFRSNDLRALLDYLESEESGAGEHISSMAEDYGVTLHIYAADTSGGVTKVNPSPIFDTIMGTFYNTDTLTSISGLGAAITGGLDTWQPLLEDEELMATQYDVIAGRWPEKEDEIVLLVDENNEVNDVYLYSLGIKDQAEMAELLSSRLSGESLNAVVESWSYDDILSMEFRLVLPGDLYGYDEATGAWVDHSSDETWLKAAVAGGLPLRIVGIIRPSENASAAAVNGAVGYRRELSERYLDMIEASAVVQAQLADPSTDVFCGLPFDDGNRAEPSDAEKAASFRTWVSGLSAAEQAVLYTEIASTPSEEDLQAMAETALGSLSRAELTAQAMAAAGAMGTSEEMIRQYLDSLSDEELMGYMLEGVKEQLRQTYAASASAGMESLSTADLAAMLQRQLNTTGEAELAALFDVYMPAEVSEGSYEGNLRILGYNDRSQPSTLTIYAATFEDKDAIVDIIDAYNARMAAEGLDEKVIRYTDYVGLLMSSVTAIINAISYVLVAFVSISLIVSSIMIGIITYISVLERIREIGILRAIGASKKDVARVFNAETAIVGFCAGAIGILVTVLLNIPISLIVQKLTGIPYLRSSLPPVAGAILVAISICLTLISGLIPSGMAARKDPVEALRTE